ncbi:MAG: AraC family transcriptional regulator ligand-binding domain-containing protein [Burkholderiales bacterium]|nr:AraC family transcriptional regulator ligand-binding domain-containing protein [Burkholderiales bacterium]
MSAAPRLFFIEAGWATLMRDLGLRPADVLRRAGLAEDLLSRPQAALDTAGYFRLWLALEAAVGEPLFPVRLVDALSVEVFSPPLFAALCSADLAAALQRLAQHKRLVAPMALDLLGRADGRLVAQPRWLGSQVTPPLSLMLAELAFLLRLARLGTREPVRALQLSLPQRPQRGEDIEAWFGCELEVGGPPAITFAAADIERPFLTASDTMWRVFEPELRRRLAELDAAASLGERVRALLLETLPAGQAGIDTVASRLAMSRRTLQRRLGEEGVSFQSLVARTREELARHYLQGTQLSHAEISFLLGFEDPNSFFRAFQAWTGATPERWRQANLP